MNRRAPRAALEQAPAPRVSRVGGVEVVFYPGPLPPLGDEPPTKAELDFRDLVAGELVGDRVEVRADYHAWSQAVRRAWEAENIVWFHGFENGKPVWRRERPPPEVVLGAGAGEPKAGKASKVPRCMRAPV